MVFNADIRNNFIQYGQSLQSLNLITGSLSGQTELLAKAVQNLTPKQQALALATKGVSQAQIAEVLAVNQVEKEQVQQVLLDTAIIQKKKELTKAYALEAISSQGIAESKAREIMISAGIIASNDAEVISKKKVNIAILQTKLAQEGLSATQIKAITTQLGLSTSTLTLSNYFKGLATSIKTTAKSFGMFLVSNPLGWLTIAGTVITGIVSAVSAYNQKQKETIEKAKELSNKIDSQADSIKNLVSEYEAILDSDKSTIEKTEELNEWKQELIKTYDLEKEKLADLNLEREKGIDLLHGEIEASKKSEYQKYLDKYSEQIADANEKFGQANTLNIHLGSQLDTADNIAGQEYWYGVDEGLQKLFDDITAQESEFFMGMENIASINFADSIDELNKLSDIYEYILDLQEKRKYNGYELTEDEKLILNAVKQRIDEIEKKNKNGELDIYKSSAQKQAYIDFSNYIDTNSAENVGKETFLAWKQGLMKSAQANGTNAEEQRQLETLIENQFPDLAKYFDNLDKAYGMFGIDDIINDANEGMKKAFINGLSDEDLEIATKIPDLFDEGLEGATAKIEAWKKQHPIETEVKITIDKALEEQTNKIKAITSAMEDMSETGYITSETYAELAKLGGNFTDCLEWENGKLKLNVDKLKDLEIQQLATAKSANSLAISELELKAASLAAHGQDFSDIQAQIESLMEENAVYTQLQEEIRNAKPDDKKTKDEEPESVKQFKKALAKKEHLLNTNQITEQEYYDWLDDESKRVYGNLKDYEEDLWKYDEQVYKWRQEQEEKLFDKKIENYKKLSDNALDDKIDFNVVGQKALDDLKKFNEEMQKAYGLGNVDLTKRPKVNADTMRKAGYEVDDGGTATVYSSFDFIWQGDEENGKYVAVHYTPILPDGTVLDEKTLSDYLYGTLEGSQDILSADNLGVVLKVDTDLNISDKDVKSLETDKPTQNIQDIIKACDDWDIALHNVQEQWVELDNVANQSTTSYANKFDYAREQINSAIAETQNRINELSLKTGFEDEIEELTSDLEDLYDTLEDINKKEIESQKDYISRLKDEYSDLMDEQIDQQKKLADSINESYENQIKTIDKQIDTINKVSEAEERQKKILDAEKDVKEAMQELDKASIKNRLVYSGDGTWQLKEDKTAVKEAKDNLAEKQEALDEAKQDEQISKLEEQKELLETQKDNSKEYYDKVVEDLESQKEAREKQYDILVDIYEQLGGEKRQTSLNDSLVAKLTSNGDINKAVQSLTPTERKQAITSGILTTDSNGNYAIDYSFLDKNEQAVTENTAELEKLNNHLSGKSDTVDSNAPTYNNKNLDAEGYLIGTDGKRVLHDGKPIHAKNFSDEIAKRNTSKKMTDVVKGIGKFAGYDTMQDLINAMITGEYTIPKAQLSNFMGSTISSKISQNMPRMGEYMTNAVNNTAPPINFTVNVDGSADEKTIQAMETKIGNMLISYTDKLTSSIATSSLRRQNKS